MNVMLASGGGEAPQGGDPKITVRVYRRNAERAKPLR
jgi:hypothetical protein